MEETGVGEGNGIKPSYKSWGEEQIAMLLDRHSIAYKYEHPLAVGDHGKTKIWYPDFHLPEYGMVVEYFGVNGDSGYDERTKHKMQVYKDTGIEGSFLTEDSLKGDWPTSIISQIEDILHFPRKMAFSLAL